MVDNELHGEDIVAIPLGVEGTIRVGVIIHKNGRLSAFGEQYLEMLRENIDGLL